MGVSASRLLPQGKYDARPHPESMFPAVRNWVLAAALLVVAAPAFADAPSRNYPQPPRADVVDTYWGTPVPDPYRPLENADAPKTQAWLRAEAAVTQQYLEALPYRAAIKAALNRFSTGTSDETVQINDLGNHRDRRCPAAQLDVVRFESRRRGPSSRRRTHRPPARTDLGGRGAIPASAGTPCRHPGQDHSRHRAADRC